MKGKTRQEGDGGDGANQSAAARDPGSRSTSSSRRHLTRI